MLAAERQSHIMGLLRTHGAVRVADLVDSMAVSDMTIRRDLDSLAAEGALTKVHGGAVSPITRSTAEPGFRAKSGQMEAEKRAIAESAARRVEAGMSVVLSAGTTTWHLTQQLRDVADLTVITNSPPISDIFHAQPRPDRTVILTGGIRTPSDALVGPTATAALQTVHADVAFIGAHGISVQAGFTTPNYWEAETNRALMSAAQQRIIVADSSKWGIVGVMTFAHLRGVDTLICDHQLPVDAQQQLEDIVPELDLARSGGQPESGQTHRETP
ncbi:DeoR/GlpR transcriptional regulator [Nesterenkonia sp. Hz 6-5]|nr:DeoR/GlpR transcriptional regulator [Nesterenkonia haasae]